MAIIIHHLFRHRESVSFMVESFRSEYRLQTYSILELEYFLFLFNLMNPRGTIQIQSVCVRLGSEVNHQIVALLWFPARTVYVSPFSIGRTLMSIEMIEWTPYLIWLGWQHWWWQAQLITKACVKWNHFHVSTINFVH